MEQVTYLKSLLHLNKLPNLNLLDGKYTINNSSLVLCGLMTMFILNMIDLCYPITVLIFGIILPFICIGQKVEAQDYFPFLIILLWIRLFCNLLNPFDVLFNFYAGNSFNLSLASKYLASKQNHEKKI